MNKYIAFDNGGKTFDRFTVVNMETADVFGVSENPGEPNGWQLCGNCAEHRIVLYGADWRQRLPVQKVLKAEAENYVNNARLDPEWLGHEIEFMNLPNTVQEYIQMADSPEDAGHHAQAKIASLNGFSSRKNNLKASNHS
jgi:hypothetical protein